MNYKKEYGITLTEAKKLAKEKHGALPKPGREVFVKEDTGKVSYTDDRGNVQTFDGQRKIYLANKCGFFFIWAYISPNMGPK